MNTPPMPPGELRQIFLIAAQTLREALSTWVTGTLAVSFLLISSVYIFEIYPFFLIGEATLRPFFEVAPLLLTLTLPALTMGAFADERRSGHLELLWSLPISDRALVLGKLCAYQLLLLFLLALSLPWPGLISRLAPLSWGPILSGYLGLWLLGSAYLSIGLWFSARATHPLVVWLLSFTLCLALYLAALGSTFLPPPWSGWLYQLSFELHTRQLARGVIDSRDLFFFLVAAALPLNFAIEALQSRNWRSP